MVDAMMDRVKSTEWSRWRVGGDTIDTADVFWLHTELQHIDQDVITAPRPPGDRRGDTRFVWQDYSPELTLSIATAVLRDALTGYRQLVETNFPRFGHALGLYSILPARAQGFVIVTGADAPVEWPPTLEYTLHTDPVATPSAEPKVHLELIEEADVQPNQWMKLAEDIASSVFRLPGVTQQDITGSNEREATNLAYTWLARDLHAVGWLGDSPYLG
ncbi:hypothetical protein [Streptomyces sp. NPDC087297]|uniref:hypothetical protein n=1 Tax=Streptomyces sp. NPDC087297 TaxID=3365778 RepID=UPI0038240EB7